MATLLCELLFYAETAGLYSANSAHTRSSGARNSAKSFQQRRCGASCITNYDYCAGGFPHISREIAIITQII